MFRHEITRAVQNGIKFGQRLPRLASTSSLNILPSPKLTIGKFIENRFLFSTSACCRNLDDQFQKSFQPRDEKELQMSDIYENVTESAEEVSDEILEEDLDPDAALKFTSKHQDILAPHAKKEESGVTSSIRARIVRIKKNEIRRNNKVYSLLSLKCVIEWKFGLKFVGVKSLDSNFNDLITGPSARKNKNNIFPLKENCTYQITNLQKKPIERWFEYGDGLPFEFQLTKDSEFSLTRQSENIPLPVKPFVPLSILPLYKGEQVNVRAVILSKQDSESKPAKETFGAAEREKIVRKGMILGDETGKCEVWVKGFSNQSFTQRKIGDVVEITNVRVSLEGGNLHLNVTPTRTEVECINSSEKAKSLSEWFAKNPDALKNLKDVSTIRYCRN